MARKATTATPTEEEILSYTNVPTQIAARFIGWSDITIRYALQEERCPFGIAARNPNTNTWSYNISPGGLIKYKRGELEYYRLNDLVKMISGAIEREMDTRLTATQDKLATILRI